MNVGYFTYIVSKKTIRYILNNTVISFPVTSISIDDLLKRVIISLVSAKCSGDGRIPAKWLLRAEIRLRAYSQSLFKAFDLLRSGVWLLKLNKDVVKWTIFTDFPEFIVHSPVWSINELIDWWIPKLSTKEIVNLSREEMGWYFLSLYNRFQLVKYILSVLRVYDGLEQTM